MKWSGVGTAARSRRAARARGRRRARSVITSRAASSNRCAQSKPPSGRSQSIGRRLWTMLPLRRSARRARATAPVAAPRSKWYSNGFSALIESCTTGTSASGNSVREHRPRAVIEAPAVVVEPDPARLHHLDHLARDVGRAGRRILDREQLVGEAVEVVDRARPRHRGHRGRVRCTSGPRSRGPPAAAAPTAPRPATPRCTGCAPGCSSGCRARRTWPASSATSTRLRVATATTRPCLRHPAPHAPRPRGQAERTARRAEALLDRVAQGRLRVGRQRRAK